MPSPVTSNRTSRALASACSVKVTRSGGGFGESWTGATQCRRVGDRALAGEQRRRVTVLAESEQDDVEGRQAGDHRFHGGRRGLRAELGGKAAQRVAEIAQRRVHHGVVAVGVTDRQTALVRRHEHDALPVDGLAAHELERELRRVAAGDDGRATVAQALAKQTHRGAARGLVIVVDFELRGHGASSRRAW